MTARLVLPLSRIGAALALALSTLSAVPALAQDPPTRAGRIAYAAGAVSFSPAGTDAWAQAALNRPLVAGDRLWTEPGARDEAQFGPAIARMDGGTLMTVLAADEGVTQLQVSQGRIDLHVRRIGPHETVEVDTPNLAFVARAPGDYRIVVAPDGSSTDVATLRGSGDVYGDGNAYNVGPGQGWRFAGQDLANLGAVPIQPYDDFDRWAFARDQRLERAQSARFVPADVVGYEDLDDYGAWRVVPDYGTVWVPTRVAADWAPYRSGHWAWIDPWGWTWVDDEPWGYAVSHYGRWASIDNRWAWVPAPQRERPVFAPALVAFVGAALAFGGGDGPGVGWFPLAPREPYRPPYYASPTYVVRVNVSNTTIRQTVLEHELRDPGAWRYANRAVPGALVAMPAAQFAQAVPVGRAAHVLPPQVAMRAPLAMAPAARPLPQSRIGAQPARQAPPLAAQQRIAVAHALPHGLAHAAPMPAGRPGGPAQDRRALVSGAAPGGAPLRMLRPAPAVRPGVPPPNAPGPHIAGQHGARPDGRFGPYAPPAAAGMAAAVPPALHPTGPGRAGPHGQAAAPQPVTPGAGPGTPMAPGLAAGGGRLPPPSAPYPIHGHGVAGPGPHVPGHGPGPDGVNPAPARPGTAFAQPHGGAPAQPLPPAVAGHAAPGAGAHAPGRSGMQDLRPGAPEPHAPIAAAPAASAAHVPGHAQPAPQPQMDAPHGVEHGGRPGPQPHGQAQAGLGQVAGPAPQQSQAQTHGLGDHQPPMHAPPAARPMPATHVEAARPAAPHDAPAPHAQPQPQPPHPQPAPQSHAQAATPHMQAHPQAQPAPHPQAAPQAHTAPAPQPHPQPAPRAEPAQHPQPAPPHPQPAPQAQPAPHPQATPPHAQAAAPQPAQQQSQPQPKGGGHQGGHDNDHDNGKDHGHGH